MISLDSLRVNKMRSLLTMVGIIVGVASVVLVVSIGQIGRGSVVSELAKYSSGVFFVSPKPGTAKGDSIELTTNDIREISRLEGVRDATGSLYMTLEAQQLQTSDEKLMFNVTGTFTDFARFYNFKMEAGRMFNINEQKTRQKVIIVESDYAVKAFGSSELAINRKVSFKNGNRYEIVGVFKSDKSLLAGLTGNSYNAYMPYDSMPLLKEGTNYKLSDLMIISDATSTEERDKVERSILKYAAQKHKAEVEDFQIQKVEDFQKSLDMIFNVMQILIGSIAGISLLVGGVGVMNIMLVSVTERTKEIGTRKAIGATPSLILQQFMMEAIILCFIGGMLGIGFGALGSFLFAAITQWEFVLSGGTVVLAFGFSAAVGLFFGWYPAKKAANMQPIEALRYE